MKEWTAEQVKKLTLKQIEDRGLDDVLNELSAILACWMNFKNEAKKLFSEEELSSFGA